MTSITENSDQKRVKVYYDEGRHVADMTRSYEIIVLFNKTVKEVEDIIKKPIEDYKAFKDDVYGYSLAAIKKAYPKPFELGLDNETTLKMLSIDLTNIKRNSHTLQTTPYKILIDETGKACECRDTEPYCQYAETLEQHERLNFCNELIALLDKAHSYDTNKPKGGLTIGFNHLIYFDMPTQQLKPNHYFVMRGLN